MSKVWHQLLKPSLFLMLLLISITSCISQVSTYFPKDSLNDPKTVTKQQSKMIRAKGTEYSQVGCGFMDTAGNLWFGTLNEGVYRYDGEHFTQFTVLDGLSDNRVSAIIEDKAGNILFGTKSGICKYDGTCLSSLTQNEDATKKSISSLLEDCDGNLWFGVWGEGVYRFNGTSFTNFLNRGESPFNLGSNYQLILDMLQDRNGNIWFTSWNGGGVWRYDGKSIDNYLPSPEYYLNYEDDRSLNKPSLTNIPPKLAGNLTSDHISDDMIFSMTEDKAGNLWFATRRHGACRFNGHSFTSITKNNGFANRGMYAILQDTKGNMWFTTEKDGIWRYNGKTFKHFTTNDGLVNNSVWCVVEDRKGNLWFGTRDFGLSRYDGKTFTTFSE